MGLRTPGNRIVPSLGLPSLSAQALGGCDPLAIRLPNQSFTDLPVARAQADRLV